jgi:hypothetical protein
MLYPIYAVVIKIIGKGPSNRLSKPDGLTDENLTGCLQRYTFLGYESDRKRSSFQTNNVVLQMIPRENNCDFHERNRDIHIFTFSKI